MQNIMMYIGPGVGAATVVLVFVVLGIVFLSLVVIVIRPLKRFFSKLKRMFSNPR